MFTLNTFRMNSKRLIK